LTLQVVLAPTAAKDLDGLVSEARSSIVADLGALASGTRTADVKRLRGFKPPLDRLRSGHYRVLFRRVGEELHVYRVIDRKKLDRAIKRFR